MFRKTPKANIGIHGMAGGFRFWLAHLFWPNMFREYLAVQNAHKIERGIRLQTALKANKVDIRHLLALPVTDHAHPYKSEFPWEKIYAAMDPKALTLYGKWYRSKVLAFYEINQLHKWGMLCEDIINAKGWWARAARTRTPKKQLVHCDRRVTRGRILRDKYIYEPKKNWVHPVDNVSWMGPYVIMISDEWEEKWGFFSGQEVEY